jgi:DNA-directed RNA polymerase alpha subunit
MELDVEVLKLLEKVEAHDLRISRLNGEISDLERSLNLLATRYIELEELTIERIEKFCARLAVLEQACVGAAMDRKDKTIPPTTSVHVLNLDVRPANALRAMGVETLERLVQLTPTDLLRSRNCGHVTVRHIQEKLEQRGLGLKESP